MELLGLLVPLNEELLSLFPVDLKEVGVEVSRVRWQRLVAPQTRVFIVDFSNEPLVGLLSVHLELSRKRCLDSGLDAFDLVAIMDVVVKDLPLLDLALVHLELLLTDAFRSDHFLNPVLELNADVLHSRVVGDARVVTLVPSNYELGLVVLLIQIPVARVEVSVVNSGTLSSSIEIGPHLCDGLVGVWRLVRISDRLEVVHVGLLLEEQFAIEIARLGVQLGNLVDEVVRVLGRSVGLLLLADVVGAVAERSLPVLLIQVGVVLNVEGARTWGRIPVLDLFGDVVVLVSLHVACKFESLEPFRSCLSCFLDKFFDHYLIYLLIIGLSLLNRK